MSDPSMRNVLVLAIIGLVSAAIGRVLITQLHAPPAKAGKLLSDKELTQDDWLLGASNDTERFRRLQQQFIGFAQPMLEISERFRRIYESLGRSNYERAAYHWTKIQQALTNAIMRRPARSANAHVFF